MSLTSLALARPGLGIRALLVLDTNTGSAVKEILCGWDARMGLQVCMGAAPGTRETSDSISRLTVLKELKLTP